MKNSSSLFQKKVPPDPGISDDLDMFHDCLDEEENKISDTDGSKVSDKAKSIKITSLIGHEKSIKNIRVIKRKFKPILRNAEFYYDKIFDVVQICNQMSYFVHIFLNFHIIRLLENNLPLPNFLSQQFLNDIICVIIPIKGKLTVKKEFSESVKEFKECFPENYEFPDRDSIGQIQNFLKLQMETEITNHLDSNLNSRFGRYLKSFYGIEDAQERIFMTNRVFYGPSKYKSKFDKYKDDKEKEAYEKRMEIMNRYCKVIQELNGQENKEDYYKELLKFHYQMLKKTEDLEGKKWSLLPEKGTFISSHMSLSTSCLPDLLYVCNKGSTKKIYKERFMEKMDTLWDNYFKIPSKNGTYKFSGTITTNGYDVSIHYYKLKNEFKIYLNELGMSCNEYENLGIEEKIEKIVSYKKQIKEEDAKKEIEQHKNGNKNKKGDKNNKKGKKDNKKEKSGSKIADELSELVEKDYIKIWGNDPGDRCLFTMSDKDDNVLRCTKKEYKHLTGQTKRLKRVNMQKDKLWYIKEISKYSLHTSSIEKYKTNLVQILRYVRMMFGEYKREFYRKLRFTAYVKKQTTYDTLCKRINGDEKKDITNKERKEKRNEVRKILIGWGDGGDGTRKGLKGSKLPCKGFKEEVERACDKVTLKSVDEYLTTKMCSKCGNRTCEVKVEKEIIKRKKVEGGEKISKDLIKEEKVLKKVAIYGLRRCMNNECRITWNRDINASRNILKILECDLRGMERPQYLKRPEIVPETSLLTDTNQSSKDLGITPEKLKTKIKINLSHRK